MSDDETLQRRAEFCKSKCPVCTRAREGNSVAAWFVRNVDRKVCPMCKAYEEVYDKKAHE